MKKLLFITAVLFFWSCQVLYADDVSKHIAGMTIRQKVGQILLIGLQGKNLDPKDIVHIKKINPGGIVFYRRNLSDASDIALLIAKIKTSLNSATPLFFAVDQEGWIVHRIGGELYTPPSAPVIGAIGSEELAREVGLSVGNALRVLGININLAPVLDVPSDIMASPMVSRCFSNNFRSVEALGTSYLSGLKDAGLLATAKHFPGIGRAKMDSHYKLPHIKWGTPYEKEADIIPFAGAIRAGVDMVMVGHVIAEPGDGINLVSLSPYWLRDVVRKELKFNGLIIVDNIEMKAIEDIMPVSKAAVKAFKAGADIIMVSHEKKNQKAVFNALMNAVRTGDISRKRLNESVRRIIEAKKKITSKAGTEPNNGLPVLSRLAAEGSVVDIRLKDVPSADINKEGKVLYIGNNLSLFDVIRDFFRYAEILGTPLLQYKELNPEINIKEFIQRFDGVIIDASYRDAAEIISLCKELNLEYVVILSSYPGYTLATINRLQPRRTVITLENSKPHLQTAAEIISGLRKAKGRLPYNLTLPADYAY